LARAPGLDAWKGSISSASFPDKLPEAERVDQDLNGSTCPAGNNPSNPVHSALGTKIQHEVDYVLDDGFVLSRTYLSRGSLATGSFGWGWRNPVDRRFLPFFSSWDSPSPSRLWIRFGPGDAAAVIRGADGQWAFESVRKDVLVRDATVSGSPGIEIIDGRYGSALYTIDGTLQEFRPHGGIAFSYMYDAKRRVAGVRSAQGREIRFEYGFEPLLNFEWVAARIDRSLGPLSEGT
jgi:hypothetical protein